MKDSIWFSYKARIQAHNRLDWLDFHSQMLLVWYAILSATLGILTIRYEHLLGPDTDMMATVLSIALLGVSLAVTNRDFRVRAMLMRRNYLQLQALYRELSSGAAPTPVQTKQYDELLAECENHREIDDRIARVFASGLTSRNPTVFENCYAISWLAARLVITAALYALPLAVGILTWMS
ncbi:TPA: SLATT domain-containing protein [Pseudomonas aeruginosa]|uniref:SLATT domain-containing protein n=1 Tax=Pseudomonas aeruginosa TaxID=287 RepID=UPI001A1E474A|nr:SLATT domain-containing protein [Pseudomonas aeruginosa]MCO2125446.1 SLATT domain-containing protein [Pseudomonas aeruginosa]HBO4423376.1 SLATT domain-containing protein [Pseudomonas aeruginosa]HBO4892082.1 SLATT domain-containing protein [Pseudomonas aeruginosa]HEQ1288584.1 SLATT domain-containing protein [Pseudomonas aeruginosa]